MQGRGREVAEPPRDRSGARLASAVAWGRAQMERAQARAEDARGRSRLIALGFDLAQRDRMRLGSTLAGALAFRFFLWLLPFSLFMVGVFGGITSINDGTPDRVSSSVGLQGVIGDLISDGARQRGWWIAMVIGLFGTLYAGMGAVRVLRVSHAAAWGMRPTRGPNPLVASVWLAGITLGLIVLAGLIGWLRNASFVAGLVALLAMTVVYFVVWTAVSSRLPHADVPAHALMPGALLVAVGTQGLHMFTVYYLAGRAERAASLYGAIGAALALLLWLFILARLMVGAAIMNAELARAGADRDPETR